MKKTISLVLSMLMLLSLALTGCAAETQTTANSKEIILQIGNPQMTINGAEKPIDDNDTAPVIVNERTLLPVRAVVEEMGGSVLWNGETKEVTLNYGADEIKLTIDSKTAYLNGEGRELDTAPQIINDRTMLPIRFIAESFTFDVFWTAKLRKLRSQSRRRKLKPNLKPSLQLSLKLRRNQRRLLYISRQRVQQRAWQRRLQRLQVPI